MKTHQIAVRLPLPLYRAVRATAKRAKTSFNKFAIEALQKSLQRRRRVS